MTSFSGTGFHLCWPLLSGAALSKEIVCSGTAGAQRKVKKPRYQSMANETSRKLGHLDTDLSMFCMLFNK